MWYTKVFRILTSLAPESILLSPSRSPQRRQPRGEKTGKAQEASVFGEL